MSNVKQHRIAKRELHDSGSDDPVVISVFAPEKVNADDDEWACRVVVTRTALPSAEYFGRGVDSLQALINALSALRPFFGEEIMSLRWLNGEGDVGLPVVIHDEDPDFLMLVDNLIKAELSRQLIWRRALHKALAGRKRPPNSG